MTTQIFFEARICRCVKYNHSLKAFYFSSRWYPFPLYYNYTHYAAVSVKHALTYKNQSTARDKRLCSSYSA